jgi:hypothetical protein
VVKQHFPKSKFISAIGNSIYIHQTKLVVRYMLRVMSKNATEASFFDPNLQNYVFTRKTTKSNKGWGTNNTVE